MTRAEAEEKAIGDFNDERRMILEVPFDEDESL